MSLHGETLYRGTATGLARHVAHRLAAVNGLDRFAFGEALFQIEEPGVDVSRVVPMGPFPNYGDDAPVPCPHILCASRPTAASRRRATPGPGALH